MSFSSKMKENFNVSKNKMTIDFSFMKGKNEYLIKLKKILHFIVFK